MSDKQPPKMAALPAEEALLIQRYCREQFQRRLGEVLQQSGVTSAQLLDTFLREIAIAHDALASRTTQRDFDHTIGLTASRISLVGDEELALEIRIDEIAAQLRSNEQLGHWRVQLRYMTLLQCPDMRPEDNPLGLEPISRALRAFYRESRMDTEWSLVLLERINRNLQQRLPEIYAELNSLLEHHRIEPATIQIRRTSAAPAAKPPASQEPEVAAPMDALTSLQQAIARQSGSATAAPSLEHAPSARQQESEASPSASQPLTPRPAPEHVAERSDSARTAPAFSAMSALFEIIFMTPDMPDSIKLAMARLQIPLLEHALREPAFFSDPHSPARQLLNRLWRAGLGLVRDAGYAHPVCAKIREISEQVRPLLTEETGDLVAPLEMLETLIATRERVLKSLAQPYVQLVQQHEMHTLADAAARKWLLGIQPQAGHPEIFCFFAECWFHVMHRTFLSDLSMGARWQEFAATANDLLASIRPRHSEEERKELLQLISPLRQRLNTGFELAGIPLAVRKHYLDVFLELQTAILRQRNDDNSSPHVATAPSHPLPESHGMEVENTVPQMLEVDGRRVLYYGRLQLAEGRGGFPWKEGDWLSFHLPGDEVRCGLICWQGAPCHTVVLFNNAWSHAIALSAPLIEQQLQHGEARIIVDDGLFDKLTAPG